jgi:hypothetical protein
MNALRNISCRLVAPRKGDSRKPRVVGATLGRGGIPAGQEGYGKRWTAPGVLFGSEESLRELLAAIREEERTAARGL